MAIAAAAWAGLLLTTQPVSGQTTRESQVSLSAAELLALADRLVAEQRLDEAEALYRLALNDREAAVQAEARFRLAMLLQRSGREREAAVHLRRIVDDQPDAQRARLELATLLAHLGDEAAARRELRSVLTRPLPPEIARGVERFEEALRRAKPAGANLSLGLAPDSNVNRATRSSTLGTVIGDFTIDPEGQARSGIGLALSGNAYGRLPLSESASLTGRVFGSGRFYRDGRFNDRTLGVSLGPTIRVGQDPRRRRAECREAMVRR